MEEDRESGHCTIDLADIRNQCPILLSTFKETMRYRSLGTQVRICLEDQVLNGRYLLKKGGIVTIPQLVQHTSEDAWGSSVYQFDHLRFMKGALARERRRTDHTAYRAFGGGHTMCPGRHFSTTEIIAFAALMVLQFDVAPVGDGTWKEPTWTNSPMVSTFQIPDKDFKVSVRAKGSRRWRVSFTKGVKDTNTNTSG